MDVSVPEQKFEQFLKRLEQRDNEAWSSLYFVLERAITYWLLKNYGNSQFFDDNDLDEIFQEAFSKLFEIITGEVETPTEFKTFKGLKSYATGIAKNMVNQNLRKRKRSSAVELGVDDSSYFLTISDRSRQSQPDQIEDQDLIDHILYDLDQREQAILSMYSEGEKLVDIARQLDISAEHCRIIKHRVMQKITLKIKELDSTKPSS